MKRLVLALAISALAISALAIPLMSTDIVDAKSTKKIHFTKTVTSTSDPGQGYGDGHLAIIVPPKPGILHDGSITYVASAPVQLVVLHEMHNIHNATHPTWTVDGNTQYGRGIITESESGSHEFVGAAVALAGPGEFTVTASVDGWIRTGAIDIAPAPVIQRLPDVHLFEPQIPVTIPYHHGLFNGSQILYIITDSSDAAFADHVSDMQDWDIQTAPLLSNASIPSDLGRVYVFADGIYGDGLYGFQDEIFSTTPGYNYTSLALVNIVSWKPGQNAQTLHSVHDILDAAGSARLTINQTDIVVNAPHIAWPQGQLDTGTGRTPDQITSINHTAGTVTFTAHRGWGPAGETTYCIIVDAVPAEPSRLLGVAHSPATAALHDSPAVSRMYQFNNGLAGTGYLGYQPGIAATSPVHDNYTPLYEIYIIHWNSPATILQTIGDIETAQEEGLVTMTAARPLNQNHIINCPAIDISNLKG